MSCSEVVDQLPVASLPVCQFGAWHMMGEMADGGDNPGDKKGAMGDLVKAESMIQLALVLPAACVIGGLGGAWLDRHFHTNWIAVTGILLGATAGFIQIYKTASRQMKRD